MKINTVKEGYYIIWDTENDVKLDQKSTEVEAIQGLINYQLAGKSVTMLPPTYRVDIEQELIKEEIIYVEGYVHMTTADGIQYLRVGATRDILRLSGVNKARDGQGKFIIKRTGSLDVIDTYELYGEQPFEIDNSHEVIDYLTGRIRLWATEPWRVTYLVNGVLDPISDPEDLPADQYNASLTEEEMYRHTRQLNATHGDKIEIIAHNAEGESDTFEFRIETLHQLDQSARIIELNKQIVAIMQEPDPINI